MGDFLRAELAAGLQHLRHTGDAVPATGQVRQEPEQHGHPDQRTDQESPAQRQDAEARQFLPPGRVGLLGQGSLQSQDGLALSYGLPEHVRHRLRRHEDGSLH
jgi:hypothetical protein